MPHRSLVLADNVRVLLEGVVATDTSVQNDGGFLQHQDAVYQDAVDESLEHVEKEVLPVHICLDPHRVALIPELALLLRDALILVPASICSGPNACFPIDKAR